MTSGPVLRSLTGDRAFQRLRKGRTGGSQHLSVRLRPTRVGYVRVGFVVSRKVGKAVVRNRIRRRLREALRGHLVARAERGTRDSYDLLVIVRPSAAGADYASLASGLVRALERAGVAAVGAASTALAALPARGAASADLVSNGGVA